jgi:ribosome assembly protein 1
VWQEWLFAPERGNVVFASSLYCWAFGVSTFARIWAGKLGVKRGLLQRHLWGDFVFNAKTLAVSRYTQDSKAKPMFVAMVLDPIWQLYEVTVLEQDLDKAAKMVKRLGLEVPPRELNPKDARGTASAIFRRWLPLAPAVLDMVVDVVPDPAAAQHRRIAALWPPDPIVAPSTAAGAETVLAAAAATEEVRASVAACAKIEAAPVVAFVSKVVLVRAAELVGWRPRARRDGKGDDGAEPPGEDAFIAFARVFSGVLRPDSSLFVLGPKYHPRRLSTASHAQPVPSGSPLGLFMMMGTAMHPVPFVPAGNLVAIAGIEGLVIKSATLASTLACPALRAMTLQAKPIVRVAVEVVRQADLDALERGLAKLYQADPAVEISVQENGEHVITALGELHLEQCIKVGPARLLMRRRLRFV